MEEYKAIMKLVDEKLAEDEMRIEYLRGEVDKLNKELETVRFDNEGLLQENKSLINEVKRQDAVITDLKETVKVLKGDCNNGN
jgi:chromosome segregation ATPase